MFDYPAVLIGFGLLLLTSACTSSVDDKENASVAEVVEVEMPSVASGLPIELEVAAAAQLPCHGLLADPPSDFEQVLDVVALPASPLYPNALQTSARGADDGTIYYFAKTGLWWRGDATFEIVVPTELRPVMAIGWGGPAELSHNVRGDCALSDSWTVMAGGYWVTEPMCAEVIVRVGSKEQRVEIGLGTPCTGQDSPVGPSDG